MERIVALDVDYRDSAAMAAGVWFHGWAAESSECERVVAIRGVAEYQPGEFYRRELPCLLQLLAEGPPADVVIVDGYVWLREGRPGLGAHLFEALGRRAKVIGVAKTRFVSAAAVPLLRGGSRSPLFVTAGGASAQEAAAWIAGMSGPYRLPTLLKQVDRLARTSPLPPTSGL